MSCCSTLCTVLFTGLPIGVFQSMFSVFAMETFKLPAEQNGYLLSYVGVLTMVCINWYLNTKHRFLSSMLEFFPLVYFSLSLFQIVQGLGVGVLTKKFSENDILKWSSFLLVWSYLALVRFDWYINKKECQVSITADNSPVNMMFSVGFGIFNS